MNKILKTRKYPGNQIFKAQDQFGLIEVVDETLSRSLYFDSFEKQSAMDLTDPNSLVLAYTKTMMTGLLFIDEIKSVLCIGLGGASIPKFLLLHYPGCKIDIIELRKKVTEIAFEYFLLPMESRLKVHIGDAIDVVKRLKPQSYDMIILDAYTQFGMPDSITRFSFMNNCKNLLNEKGIISINLWNKPKEVLKTMNNNINKCFNNQSMVMPVKEKANLIAFGFNQPGIKFSYQQLQKQSVKLENRFFICLPEMLNSLRAKSDSAFWT
ncbi:fused MFS/spermidine synthase [bacterium]|nr:fused MFS/spermidine synthase [bacterium]